MRQKRRKMSGTRFPFWLFFVSWEKRTSFWHNSSVFHSILLAYFTLYYLFLSNIIIISTLNILKTYHFLFAIIVLYIFLYLICFIFLNYLIIKKIFIFKPNFFCFRKYKKSKIFSNHTVSTSEITKSSNWLLTVFCFFQYLASCHLLFKILCVISGTVDNFIP